jgi:hypothetical protein
MRRKMFLIRFKENGRLDYRVAGTPIKVRNINPSLFASTGLKTKFVSNQRILGLQEELSKKGRARFIVETLNFSFMATT